ncbi:hypothetical protein Tco_1547693 [Tanacetum coccineum]
MGKSVGRQETSADSLNVRRFNRTHVKICNSLTIRPKPTPYPDFVQTPGGGGRNCLTGLDLEFMVNSFEELSLKFLEEFSQQKRYAKDPTEIHGIKRRQNEGLQTFMDRFKSESSHIKGVPPVLRISAFMHGHGHGHPELAKKLNEKIPKTVDEMFERVRAFIRGEVAAGTAEMVLSRGQGVKTQKMQSSDDRFFRRNTSSPGSNRSSSNHGKSRKKCLHPFYDQIPITRESDNESSRDSYGMKPSA